MLDQIVILLIIFLLIIFQSIIGIGVLVLGTPILLIWGYNLIDILSFLLPFSILTSSLNIFLIKSNLSFKKVKLPKVKLILDDNLKLNFFFICLPSLFIGLVVLKIFENYINFKLSVGLVILFSLLIKIFYERKNFHFSNFLKKIIFFLIGIVHGITNSGGTLLTIFISSLKEDFKKISRLNITLLYFFLATFQYLTFIFLFQKIPSYIDFIIIFFLTFVGSILGNVLIKFVSENLIRLIINFTALISSLILIINSL